ncbi:MAG: putative LPS assembly protein LptD [candidate division WOR-3 bacterium]
MNFLLLVIVNSAPLFFESGYLIYFADSGVFVLKDYVKIKKESTELYADSLVYFRERKLMKAFGNAVLIFGSDTLVGDSIYYYTESRNGFAFLGKFREERGIFRGNILNKDSTDTIYVAGGTFTTCEHETPHYRFRTFQSKIILKDMAIVKPVLLEVHDLPVIMLPFWMFPLSKERKSGFLVPRFGINSSDGKYIRNLSYYFVINHYSDLTLALDMFEKRGLRGSLDFEFYRYRFGKINASYSLAQEWSPLWRKRWTLSGNLELGPFYGFRITGVGQYYSDNEILNDYSDIKENWLKREVSSYLGFSRSFGRLVISGGVDDRLDLSNNFRTSRVPYFQIGLPQLRVKDFGVSSNLSFLRQYFKRGIVDTVRWGTRFNASTGYSLRMFKYIRFNFSINGSLGLIDYDTAGKPLPLVKNFNGSATFGTVLYGRTIFGINNAYLTHTFQPSVNLSFQPKLSNPVTDYYFTSLGPQRFLSMGISFMNNFGVMLKERNIDFISVGFSSYTNLLDTLQKSKFNTWNISSSSLGQLPISIRLNAVFYFDSLKIKNPTVNLSYRLTLPMPRVNFEDSLPRNTFSIFVNYSLSKYYFVSQTLSFNGNFNLGKSFRINFGGSYDFSRKEIISKTLSISKDLHCWEASFSYSGFGTRWDYNFRVWIKKLPDVKVEKSIFDLFLP